MSKDVRICSYFSKPKGIRKQKHLGNTVPADRKFSVGMSYTQFPSANRHWRPPVNSQDGAGLEFDGTVNNRQTVFDRI
jgi:hypothetical protein